MRLLRKGIAVKINTYIKKHANYVGWLLLIGAVVNAVIGLMIK